MLRGDLEVVRDRLVRSGRVSALDAEADALAAAWEVVTRRPPPGRWERGDAIWNQARRVSRMRRRARLEAEPLPEDFDLVADDAEPEPDWLERSPGLLAAAVAAGVLSPRRGRADRPDPDGGRPLAEVARALGRPYDAVRKERRRAEAALRTFARALRLGRVVVSRARARMRSMSAGSRWRPASATSARARCGLPGPQMARAPELPEDVLVGRAAQAGPGGVLGRRRSRRPRRSVPRRRAQRTMAMVMVPTRSSSSTQS